jgi:predicted nucleic acid-binding Zn ribbon protein
MTEKQDLDAMETLLSQRRPRIRQPARMAEVVSRLMSKRGYGRVLASDDLNAAWRRVVDPRFADDTRAAQVKRGVLEVIVANSSMLHELTFDKKRLLARMQAEAPDQKIKDLRLKVGAIR